MTLQIRKCVDIIKAGTEDYPVIQNMARFYVYDLSRLCGFTSKDWACPANGLYESFNFGENWLPI